MESIQPFLPLLLFILVLLLAVSMLLVVRMWRDRRRRRQEQAVIVAASPRVQSRLAAIGDQSIPPEPEPPFVPYAVLTAVAERVSLVRAESTRRRVWRDASAALILCACIGLVVVVALPASGQGDPHGSAPPTEVAAIATGSPIDAATPPTVAVVPTPLPTRVEVALPSEAPSATLPATKTPRPTERVTGIAAATPKPTAKPKPKATAKPKPTATPVPDPIARFSCTFQGGLTVAFDSTSRYAQTHAWDFDGDGTSSAANPTHEFSGSGAYRVSLTVANASGSDTATKLIDLDAGTGCQ